MPHILAYGSAISDRLYREAAPNLSPRIEMTCRSKYSISETANGSHVWSSEYIRVTLDITDRVDSESPIRIITKKPEVPTGSGTDMRGANVTLTILNPDTYWAVTQDGAILDPDSITNAYIDIFLPVGSTEIKVYRGRVIGRPSETRGKTTFTVRDAVADLVDIPLRWEKISQDQNTSINTYGTVSVSSHTTPSGLRFYDAYVYFDYTGLPSVSVTNSKGDAIGLRDIDFNTIAVSSLDISKFEITFVAPETYRVTGPNIPAIIGSINEDFDSGFMKIPASAWDVVSDPTGAVISFQTCYTVSGNPVTIIKRIIEHAFLQTWGNEPTQPSFLPVDWDKFDRLEKEFDGVTVYVSETNKDPSVYNLLNDSKPTSVKNVVELISEHIGSSIIVDDFGRISITSVFLDPDELVYDVSSEMLVSHSFPGGNKRFNALTIGYGTDPISSSYNSETVFTNFIVSDYDPTQDYEEGDVIRLNSVYWQAVVPNPAGSFIITNWVKFTPNTKRINLRYFKSFTSDRMIQFLQCYILDRVFMSYDQIVAKVIPQFGIMFRAGDVVRFTLDEKPARTMYAEIVKVSKIIGGEVSITAQAIPDPVTPSNYCEGDYCAGNYE